MFERRRTVARPDVKFQKEASDKTRGAAERSPPWKYNRSTIRFQANDHEQLEKEEALIREVLSKVSTKRGVENNGRIVTFKPLPIDVESSRRVEASSHGNDSGRKNLVEDWLRLNKISELMEEEIRGADIDEEETDAQQNVRVDSQMRFWIEFLNRYAPTNTISNFQVLRLPPLGDSVQHRGARTDV